MWNLVPIIQRMPEERSLKSSCVCVHSARFASRRVPITSPAFAKALQKHKRKFMNNENRRQGE